MRKKMMVTLIIMSVVLLSGTNAVFAKTQISFWHSFSGQLSKTAEQLIGMFNESQDEFEVQGFYRGTYDESLTAAIAAVRSGNPPAVLQAPGTSTQSLLLSGVVYPVHQLMADQAVGVDWEDFLPAIFGVYSHEGNLYSLPFNTSTPILYYNKDMFAEAGLDPEQPPITWQDVEKVSRILLDSGAARYGFTTGWPGGYLVTDTLSWHGVPLASHGNGFDSLDAELLINSGLAVDHISSLAKWQEEGIYHYGGRGDNPNWLFLTGECAMMLHSSALIGSMKESGINWGATEIPHWGDPYPKVNTTAGGATLWVMKGHDSTIYRGVAEFFDFLIQPEQQAWWHRQTGYVPASKSAMELLTNEGHFDAEPYQLIAVNQLVTEPTVGTRGVRLGDYVEVRSIIEDELENIFGGKKSVQDALDSAVKEGNIILQEFAEIYQ